ncbi:MAG: extracellular solute-binding protein, partial [Chloroflexi bacterium]|nr:extracellular solute-binding protein [Chloroflexota bacterium]
EEVDEYSRKINLTQGGSVVRIGMVPWGPYGFSNAMFTWGWAFGGDFYDPDKEEVTPDNEYVVKALEWMVNYAKSIGGADKVNVAPPNLQQTPFVSGNIGMSPLVEPNVLALRKANPGMNIGVGLLPYQGPGATKPGAGGWFGGWSSFIPRGAKHPDEAWEFIKWIAATSDGTQAQWGTAGCVPAYKQSPVLETMQKDPVLGAYHDVLLTAQHSRPAFPVSAFYVAQLDQYVSNAIYGKSTPLEALRTVKANTMREWDRFKREVTSS